MSHARSDDINQWSKSVLGANKPFSESHGKILKLAQQLPPDQQPGEMRIVLESFETVRKNLSLLTPPDGSVPRLSLKEFLATATDYLRAKQNLSMVCLMESHYISWRSGYEAICEAKGIQPASRDVEIRKHKQFLNLMNDNDPLIAIATALVIGNEEVVLENACHYKNGRLIAAYGREKSQPMIERNNLELDFNTMHPLLEEYFGRLQSNDAFRAATSKALKELGLSLRVFHVAFHVYYEIDTIMVPDLNWREIELTLERNQFLLDFGKEYLKEVDQQSVEALFLFRTFTRCLIPINRDKLDLPAAKTLYNTAEKAATLAEKLDCPYVAAEMYSGMLISIEAGATGATYAYGKHAIYIELKSIKYFKQALQWVPSPAKEHAKCLSINKQKKIEVLESCGIKKNSSIVLPAQPFAEVIGSGAEKKDCVVCGTTTVAMKKCSRCGKSRYCSRACQEKHWPTHKVDCRPAEKDKNKEKGIGKKDPEKVVKRKVYR